MPAVNKIVLSVDVNSSGAEQAIDEINKKIAAMGPNAAKSSDQASTGLTRVTATIEQATTAMDKMASAISALGIARIAQEALAMGDSLNRIQLGFENLEGGASLMRQLRVVAQQTSSDFADLAKGAQMLVNAGTAPGVVARQMRILADQTAYSGKTMTDLLAVVEKFRNMTAKDKVSIRDIAAPAGIGVNFLAQLRQATGDSRQKIQVDLKDINPQAALELMFDAMEKMSQGAGKKLQGSLLSQAFNEVKSKAEDLAQAFNTALTPSLISLMEKLNPVLVWAKEAVQWFGRLPEPVKKLAEAIALLALAAKGLSIAFGLWSLLPNSIGLLRGIFAGAMAAKAAIAAFTYGLGLAEAAGLAFSAAAEGIGTAIAAWSGPIGWAIGALGLLYIAYQKWANRPGGPEDKRIQEENAEFAKRSDLLKQAQKAQNALEAAHIKVPEPPKGIFKIDPSDINAVKDANALLEGYNQTLTEAGQKRKQLVEANEEEIKRARDYGAKLLADAQRDQLKITQQTIEALGYAWHEHWKNTKVDAKATADALKALGIAMTTEMLKQVEVVKTAQHKATLENATLARKIAIDRMEALPGENYINQLQIAEARFLAHGAEIGQQMAENIRKNREFTEAQQKGADYTFSQMAQMAKNPAELAEAFKAYQTTYQGLAAEQAKYRGIEVGQAGLKIEEARVELAKTTNATLFQMEKDTRDKQTEYEIAQINAIREYEIASVTAVEAYTKQQKLAQINATLEANLNAITATRDAQKKNLDDTLEQYAQAVKASDRTAEMKTALIEGYKEFYYDPALKTITQTFNNQEQQLRIESWRAGNQVIIQEQTQVFQSIAGVMGELFDALVEKNKSVWAAIGDVIKKTLLNAIKAVVTSNLAAALTGMLGYGPVTIAAGPLGQPIPMFGGMGAPPTGGRPAAPGTSGSTVGFGDIANTIRGLSRQAATEQAMPSPSTVRGYLDTGGGSQGSADRMMEAPYSIDDVRDLPTKTAPVGGQGIQGLFGAAVSPTSQVTAQQRLREAFGIGVPVLRGATKIPWSQATAREKLGSIATSKGMGSLAAMFGLPMFTSSLSKRGVGAGVQGIVGGAMAGAGIASMLGAPGQGIAAGAVGGAGLGLFAAGWKRGGVSGLFMDVGGGALAGAGIGAMIGSFAGPMGFLIGAAAGALIGAGVGAVAGIIRLFHKTAPEKARQMIRQMYGVDVTDKGILAQVVDIANQRFGGNVSMAVGSPEVQEMVRLYALMSGQRAMSLPRPMYGATYAQSASGGLQLQPVYSGGQLVSSPYTGLTTTQMANSLNSAPVLPSVFLQLNPKQANSLFSGQVVQVIGDNPGAVGAANTTANRSGQGRQAQATALLEPATVTR